MDLNTFNKLSYGVYIITAWDNGKPVGCTANSAMQITMSPVTIAVSLNHKNYTTQCIRNNGNFALSILAEDTKPSIIGCFGFQSCRDTDKFAQTAYSVKGLLPVISDSCGYICCKVIDVLETSSHTIFLGEAMSAELTDSREAMTYAYYHRIIKGNS